MLTSTAMRDNRVASHAELEQIFVTVGTGRISALFAKGESSAGTDALASHLVCSFQSCRLRWDVGSVGATSWKKDDKRVILYDRNLGG